MSQSKKRTASAGASGSSSSYNEAAGSHKKARFDVRNPSRLAADNDDEEADAVLELDEIGRGSQTKRSAVKLDGYESDSSTENFDARAEAKARAEATSSRKQRDGNRDEDDDMFAEAEDDVNGGASGEDDGEDGPKAGGKEAKKAVRFIDVSEIDGQVSSSMAGGHVSADFYGSGGHRIKDKDVESSSSEDEDEDVIDDEARAHVGSDVDDEVGAGGKKKHAPKLDAFNMRQEGEEGQFDETGNYVRKAADPDAVHDSWLEGTSRKDMKRAREAHEKRDEEMRRRDREQDGVTTVELLDRLIGLLERSETVLEALQRLGRGAKAKPKPKPKWQQKKERRKQNGDAMDVDEEKEPEDPKETRRRQQVEAITEAADQLLTRGQTDIYDTERELLMRQYRNEAGEEWTGPSVSEQGVNGKAVGDSNGAANGAGPLWEYRWSDARDGGEEHGPYDGPTMTAWRDAGFFGEGVEFRTAGGGEWSRTVDFVG